MEKTDNAFCMQSSVGQFWWNSSIFENKVKPINWGLVNEQNLDDSSKFVKDDHLAVLFSFKKLQWPADLRNKMEKCTRKIISGLSPAQVWVRSPRWEELFPLSAAVPYLRALDCKNLKSVKIRRIPIFYPKKRCFL